MSTKKDILLEAQTVLEQNDQGSYTVPAGELYPHQWLWDSCFVAIGLRHGDITRAQMEILSLLRGQWHNGMLPNMIFRSGPEYARERGMWRSWVHPDSPDHVATSGITQPPVLAEAIVKIGQRLKKAERRSWYKQVFPALVKYHEWLYNERDPHQEGLVLQIHPWETGLDNTPPWMDEMHKHQMPFWIRAVKKFHLQPVFNLFRRDTKMIPSEQRIDIIEALSLLRDIAAHIKVELDEELLARMHKTETALNQLWDPYTGQYYSRNFVTHKLLKEPSVATLLPLYAGTISKERADQLVRLLENQHVFGSHFPVPSVPLNSPWYQPHGYWQGPVWINTNWLIIDGLERMGYPDHAAALKESTIDMVAQSGCYEYFSPEDGSPAGAANFSWTAALIIDLLKQK